MYRTLVAFIVSPAAPLASAGIAYLFERDKTLFGFATATTLLYAYPAAIIFGVPLYFYARRRGWLRWWQIALQAALIGGAVAVLILAFIGLLGWDSTRTTFAMSRRELTETAGLVALGFGLGGASGLLFWLIAEARMGSNFSSSGRESA
jgi:hypothetical protein